MCAFKTSGSWVILSPIEQSIKDKIERIGTPLKDWNIQINYGIKTGCNEAFIINETKRNEILDNCKNNAERKRTDELIRPILRGRDIKRYGYHFAGLYLIASHNGIPDKNIPRIDIEDYPAVKAHLDEYWDKISVRADQGDTPYNLRSCAYMDDFNSQLIVYNDIARQLTFAITAPGIFINNTAYCMKAPVATLEYLIQFLNSNLMDWYYRTLSVQLGEQAVRMFSIYVQQLPIPIPAMEQPKNLDDDAIYTAFHLSSKERMFLNHRKRS